MDEFKVVSLKFPIPIPKEGGGKVSVNELRLGRFKAKHLKLLPKSFFKDEGEIAPSEIVPLIAGLADIPVASMEEIDLEDLIQVSEGVQSFLASSLGAGKILSGE